MQASLLVIDLVFLILSTGDSRRHHVPVSAYLQHAETGGLDISSAVHVALHEVDAIFSQTCQQDALEVARLLHLIG